MSDLAKKNEGRYRDLYGLVEPYDAFVGRFVNRPHGLNTDRPQDYLACVLLVRSFRLLIGGTWLAASGYADLSPNLGRTIWEIAVRLLYSQKDPVAATIGFFMYAKISEIREMEAELAYRESNTLPVGHLSENHRAAEEYRTWLETLAKERGVDTTAALRVFGKLNIRQACREIGIEKAYLVDYSFDSGHVHERNVTTGGFMTTSERAAQYEAGPAEQSGLREGTFDVLKNFGLVATAAARLGEDETAVAEANRLLEQLSALRERGDEPLPD
jgi:hypothetical protein